MIARSSPAAIALACAAAAASAQLRAQPPAAGPSIEDVVGNWAHVNADADRFRLEDGVLHVEGGGGWLRSQSRYTDFRLTAELRFATEDADSGIFVRAEPDGEFGPGWPGSSYQVQLRNPLGDSPFPPIGGLFRHGTPEGPTRFDEAAVRRVFTGTGEWQTVIVRVQAGELTVELNGELVTEAEGIANASGYVGIQSETGALEIRSIEIEPY